MYTLRKRIEDFDLTAVQLKHLKTGADHLHIFKNDSNNVFNVAFLTAPTDSTGVPHILEHTALCGSQKFPVRDPFFKMLNRSVATYMNALTGSDITMYPFSTENEKDYYNLMDIYMDATLHPRLRSTDFRFLFLGKKPEADICKGKKDGDLSMRIPKSDVNNIFLQRLQQIFYPNTTYSHVSGGDPDAITDLTHEQLVAFHRKHYHPSNSKFFTYGNFNLSERLQKINERISEFDALVPDRLAALQQFPAAKRIVETCPFDPMGNPERQVRLSISYLTNDGTDTFETFAMQILATLLTDGAASPFYKELIETNIGTDYAPSTGYDRTARETSFSVGLQGIKEADVEMVEARITKVFENLAKTGFPKERIESALHQLELGIRHRKANFGMGLGQSIVQHWIHGGDPIASMEVTLNIKKLREALSQPGFFESRIQKYFLANPHRLVFIMKPSEEYAAQVELSEQKRLEEKVQALTADEKEKLFKDGIELVQLQEAPEDLSCLPTVTLADIPVVAKTYPVSTKVIEPSSIPVQVRATATNGVSYIRINKSIGNLPTSLIPYLSLYSNAFTALGTQKTPILADLDERIRLVSSGISASPSISSTPTASGQLREEIQFYTSALDSKLSQVFPLVEELIQGADFKHPDVFERLRTVLASAAAGGMSSLAHNGHRYAVAAASATLSHALKKRETVGGLASVVFVNKLFEEGNNGVETLLENVKKINRFIVDEQSEVRAAVNAVSDAVGVNTGSLEKLFSNLGWKSGSLSANVDGKFNSVFTNEFYAFPFNVNYTGAAFKGVSYSHEDSARLQVLAELLTHRFLHREVREKGGAYGAFAGYNALDGIFSMASYRDPLGAGVRTMDAFARGVEWAGEITKNVSQSQLNEAKMSILSSLDSPLSASDEAMTLYGAGITDELRQARRKALFDIDLESVQKVAQKYLTQPSSRAILGPKQEFEGLKQEEWKLNDFSG
ncbi:Mitochondrial presequence protease [Phlyctochytrium planicorne]|nr:Mitochondrial presequence protease [Phlyctochytrium planicorne]